jgi:anti-sigma B factor antagonist
MGLTLRSENGITILTPSGMLLGGKETDELAAKISELDAAGEQKLILDMSRVTFMSSIGIAAVLRAHISYTKRGAVVKICGLDRRMREIFALVRIAMVFGDNLHDTLEEALAAFDAMARETRPADALTPEESLVGSEAGAGPAGKGAAESESDR